MQYRALGELFVDRPRSYTPTYLYYLLELRPRASMDSSVAHGVVNVDLEPFWLGLSVIINPKGAREGKQENES